MKENKEMTYDQVCELVNMEFERNDEDLRKTVEATGLPLSVVMEATGIKDMLDFMDDDEEEDDDEDFVGNSVHTTVLPDADPSDGEPK